MADYVGGSLADSIRSVGGSVAGALGFTEEIDTNTSPNPDSGIANLCWPPDLGGIAHPNFLTLRAIDMTATTQVYYGNLRNSYFSNTSSNAIEGDVKAYIMLPAPPITEQQDHSFDGSTRSIAQEALLEGMASAKGGSGWYDSLARGVSAGAQSGGAAIVENISRGLVSNASTLKHSSSVIKDQSTVTSFKGTNLRNQTLTWTFNPKSLAELKQVGAIIKAFQSLSLPTKGRGLPITNRDESTQSFASMIRVPPVWMIEEVSTLDHERYTPRFTFGPAGISSVKLNRTPDQYWKTFSGTAGDSASIELEVTFAELVSNNRESYLSANQSGSVKGFAYDDADIQEDR